MKVESFTYHQPDTQYPSKPSEDSLCLKDDRFCVADGITRDPIGIKDFTGVDKQEWLRHYPVPSPASQAAHLACEQFVVASDTMDAAAAIRSANQKISELNKGIAVDYLENDFAACVIAGGKITANRLNWASVGDCQVAVFDEAGELIFMSPHGTTQWGQYESTHKLGDWNQPDYRYLVRTKHRNNPAEPNSYGALTGEKAAESYIKSGEFGLGVGMWIICFSDGFAHHLKDPDFFNKIKDQNQFRQWDEKLADSDYKYGHERSIVSLTLVE